MQREVLVAGLAGDVEVVVGLEVTGAFELDVEIVGDFVELILGANGVRGHEGIGLLCHGCGSVVVRMTEDVKLLYRLYVTLMCFAER